MAKTVMYSYDNVSKNKNFKEFMELINNKTPIMLSKWGKLLGFNNRMSFSNFLKRYKINYVLKLNQFDEPDTETIEQIKVDYNDTKLTIIEIASKYNIPRNKIYKYVDTKPEKRIRCGTIKTNLMNNLGVENTGFGKMKELLEKNNIKFEIVQKKCRFYFKVECCDCNKPLIIGYERRRELLGKDIKFRCYKCFGKNQLAPMAPKRPLNQKRNTSGYIGVFIKNTRNKVYGYVSRIDLKKKIIFYKSYKDETLSDKTLMEAIVDREKFIITNGLPHTRNLSDDDLFSNMEMLGQYGDISLIKLNLKEYYAIQKLDSSKDKK